MMIVHVRRPHVIDQRQIEADAGELRPPAVGIDSVEWNRPVDKGQRPVVRHLYDLRHAGAARRRDVVVPLVAAGRLVAASSASIGDIIGWLARRRDLIAAGRSSMRVGHVDFFARPTGTR